MLYKKGIYFSPDDPPAGGTPPPDPKDPAKSNGKGNDDPPKTVPYERFAEVNTRAKEYADRLEALEKAQKDAEEKALADQNKWKELAEKREGELKTERLARLKLDVALKAGLPAEFAARLQGEKEEDLMADAKTLLPLVKPVTPGNPPAGDRTPATTFTAEQLRDPKFVRENKAAILAATSK